jgi:hypothetical protein
MGLLNLSHVVRATSPEFVCIGATFDSIHRIKDEYAYHNHMYNSTRAFAYTSSAIKTYL